MKKPNSASQRPRLIVLHRDETESLVLAGFRLAGTIGPGICGQQRLDPVPASPWQCMVVESEGPACLPFTFAHGVTRQASSLPLIDIGTPSRDCHMSICSLSSPYPVGQFVVLSAQRRETAAKDPAHGKRVPPRVTQPLRKRAVAIAREDHIAMNLRTIPVVRGRKDLVPGLLLVVHHAHTDQCPTRTQEPSGGMVDDEAVRPPQAAADNDGKAHLRAINGQAGGKRIEWYERFVDSSIENSDIFDLRSARLPTFKNPTRPCIPS